MSLLCLLAAETDLREDVEQPQRWLTASEQARLQSLGTAARRDTFLAGRWLARRAVRQWLGRDRETALDVAASGACHVVGEPNVFVSISHSAGTVACAVAGVPVGVDVESLARQRNHLALAETVHSAAQCEQLAMLPADARGQPFLEWWTLKEAWLKAREQGLDFAVMRSLSFEPDDEGDAAVAVEGDRVLAVTADPALPLRLESHPHVHWRRCRSSRASP